MKAFETVEAVAVPLDRPNTDTDQIIPARFLWRARSDGYGELLFNDLREAGGFVMDRKEYAGAGVLVADRNFGCGSSREHAVWALADAGIRVVIAPSFGDIFFNNSFKNGLLPIVLPEERCAEIRAALGRNPGAKIIVDLANQTVTGPVGVNDGFAVDPFEVDAFRKELLLAGMDDITFTLSQGAAIDAFEARYAGETPWI